MGWVEETAKFILDGDGIQLPLLSDPLMICPWFLGSAMNLKNLPRKSRYPTSQNIFVSDLNYLILDPEVIG